MNNNEELIRKGFKAFSEGDLATLDELIADNVVWVAGGNNVLSGRYEDKQSLFAYFASIPGHLDGPLTQDVVKVFADDEVTVAVVELSADRRGKHLEKEPGVIVFVLKDGKVTQGRVIPADRQRDDDFWAE